MSGAYGSVKGVLFKSPEQKTSKSGNAYSLATVKVRDNDQSRFWKVMAFKNASAALMQFNEGDLIEAQGSIKFESFTKKDGSTAVSLTLLANNVSAYQPPQKQSQSTGREASTSGPNLMQRYGEYRA